MGEEEDDVLLGTATSLSSLSSPTLSSLSLSSLSLLIDAAVHDDIVCVRVCDCVCVCICVRGCVCWIRDGELLCL